MRRVSPLECRAHARRLTVLLAGLLAATPCLGQEARPITQPTRDVEVIYNVIHGTQQVRERFAWQAATGRQRVDAPSGDNFTVADRKAGTLSIVNTTARKVVQVQLPSGPLNGGDGRFHKIGEQTIAGIACTDWQITPTQTASPTAIPTIVCLTADGVALGMRTGQAQGARAVSVTYAPADAAAFVVPSDYAVVTPRQVVTPAPAR